MSHEITRVPESEITRRERHLMAHTRPYKLHDPFTWSYRAKCGAGAVSTCVFGSIVYSAWYRTPWYFGLAYKVVGTTAAATVAYFLGYAREHQSRTRDAVINHYMELYPEDFKQVNDYHGRPYSAVMLPWFPRRAQYNAYNKIDNSDYD
uniref:Uncharacterized protein n=1 Tax=Acrobeloides nanus TaxID=290746 RepID=A0A914DY69_9BILA